MANTCFATMTEDRCFALLLTPREAATLTEGIVGSSSEPRLRTTGSQLERIIRDILSYNFIQFNVHSRLQGYGLPAQQALIRVKGILRMHHFYNIGAEWVSTIICVQVRELFKPRARKN